MSYPFAYPDARQMAYASSYSTLSGALEPAPAPVQSTHYPVRSNTTPDNGVPISAYLRAQASSNPDLSGALGPPGQSHQYTRSQTMPYAAAPTSPYSGVPHPSSGSHAGSSSAHPAYPYPERNVVNPAHYTANAPPAARQKTYPTVIPRGYRPLEQPTAVGRNESPTSWNKIGSQHECIKFYRKGGGRPFCVDELIEPSPNHLPDLEGSQDQVFSHISERFLRVVISWPGYSRFPMEKRVNTENGSLTREGLLGILAGHIKELARICQQIPVESGHQQYELIRRPRGLPSIWRDCLIISFSHKSGSTWEVELHVKVKDNVKVKN